MKAIFAYIWERWWCRLILECAIGFGLLCLHTFFRQSIIGPKIAGIPWCVWEGNIRVGAGQRAYERRGSLYEDLFCYTVAGSTWDDCAPVPVLIHLADDDDKFLRRDVLRELGRCLPARESEILPILRRHLKDDDALCRAYAARGVWWAAADPEVKDLLLPLLDHQHQDEKFHYGGDARSVAAITLCQMADRVPEVFEPLRTLSEDSDFKGAVLMAMSHFGKRSIPILRTALRDKWPSQRCLAVRHAGRLCKDAADFIPDLVLLQDDPDPTVRESTAEALSLIDPVQFPPSAK